MSETRAYVSPAASTRVLDRYAEAWATDDFLAMVDCYHDDAIFHYFGRSPLAGTHRGKSACLLVLRKIRERVDRRLVAIVDVLQGRRFGAIVARERFKRNDQVFEVERLLRYEVREDKIAQCWVYDEDQRLIDSLWAD